MNFWSWCKRSKKILYKEQLLAKAVIKIRVPIASKGKGKSGGARVVTNFVVTDQTVYLLSIYDKADKENLTDKELEELLTYIPL